MEYGNLKVKLVFFFYGNTRPNLNAYKNIVSKICQAEPSQGDSCILGDGFSL